jgi:hypothetical protein
LAFGRPDGPEFLDRQAVDPVVVVVDHDGQGVSRDLQLDRLDAVGPAVIDLSLPDRSRGVVEVGVARTEVVLEAPAAAGGHQTDADRG